MKLVSGEFELPKTQKIISYINQRRLNDEPLLVADSRMLGRRLVHVHEPENGPHNAQEADNVKNELPAEMLADEAAEAERGHRAQVRAREGEGGEARALVRRRPLGPQAVHRGKDEALGQALQNAQANEERSVRVDRHRHEQAQQRAHAHA